MTYREGMVIALSLPVGRQRAAILLSLDAWKSGRNGWAGKFCEIAQEGE